MLSQYVNREIEGRDINIIIPTVHRECEPRNSRIESQRSD